MQPLAGVVETAPGRIRTECRHDDGIAFALMGSAMGGMSSLAFGGATVLVLATNPALGLIVVPAALVAFSFFGFFARELWVRLRRMGRFELDAASGLLFREGRAPGYRVTRVRPSTFMAGSFARGGVASWWVIVDVADGPSFRVAKGAWAEVRPLLGRLKALGLPVDGHDELILLRTRHYSLSKLSPTRFEFRAPETLAKIVGPLVLLFWIAFASLFVAGFVVSALNGSLTPGAAVFFGLLMLFFTTGIGIGVANVVVFTRRSGVFVLDLSSMSLERNGEQAARPGEIARFRLGSPTWFGVRPSRLLGPQVLALELRSGRVFHLLRGLPGDVRYAASVLAEAGVAVEGR